VDVIVRQVGDIKRLIDEFNFFARLPEPNFKECDLCEVCKQATFLMQNASNGVEIIFSENENACKIKGDERLLHQSIVNLIQNAINVFSIVDKADKRVLVSIENDSDHVKILIEDSGPGFPKEKIESLATPYFTLMPKGTGLGLAIVKKIVQDHKGQLSFGESILGGAKVTMIFPSLVEVKNER
jgi:two-component system nitrogen regulation sensor histidine kinase NtrY